jgi:hypothetical protein
MVANSGPCIPGNHSVIVHTCPVRWDGEYSRYFYDNKTDFSFVILKFRSKKLIAVIFITFKDAPPTRKPSISSCFASSAQFPPFTDPEMEIQL